MPSMKDEFFVPLRGTKTMIFSLCLRALVAIPDASGQISLAGIKTFFSVLINIQLRLH